MTNPNDCAFPASANHTPGLTKREYFAAMAMQGLLASCAVKMKNPYELSPDAAYCADALIAVLNKEQEKP